MNTPPQISSLDLNTLQPDSKWLQLQEDIGRMTMATITIEEARAMTVLEILIHVAVAVADTFTTNAEYQTKSCLTIGIALTLR